MDLGNGRVLQLVTVMLLHSLFRVWVPTAKRVTRTVGDGLPAGDFKSMNKRAKGLFDCGHDQNIQVSVSSSHVLLRASCIPAMKKDTVYEV